DATNWCPGGCAAPVPGATTVRKPDAGPRRASAAERQQDAGPRPAWTGPLRPDAGGRSGLGRDRTGPRRAAAHTLAARRLPGAGGTSATARSTNPTPKPDAAGIRARASAVVDWPAYRARAADGCRSP